MDKAFKQNPSALKLDSEVLKTLLQQAISGSQEAKNTAWKTLLTQNNLQPNEEQLASFLQSVNTEAQGLKKRTDDLEKQASFRFFVDQIASVPESDKKSARDAAYATIKMNMEKAGKKYNDSKFLKSLFHVLNHVARKKSILNPQEFQKKGPLMQSLQDQQLGLEVQLKNLDQKISGIKTGTFSAAQVPLLEEKVAELESALQAAKISLANIAGLLGRSDTPLWKKNLELWDSAFIPESSQQKQESSKISQEKNNSGQRLFNLNESRIKPPKKQKLKIKSENFIDLLSVDEGI